ncbi:MAG: hypothetical protein AB8G22_02065, partial [Saprospiraceae bacterium]
YDNTNQMWLSLWIGTDVLPLLVNLCSKECEAQLPETPKGYVQFPHKGGADLQQPTYEEWEKENVVKYTRGDLKKLIAEQSKKDEQPKLLKLVRKIWEK